MMILQWLQRRQEARRLAQGAACLADPNAQWIQQPNAAAFLTSVIRFGGAETEHASS
jgi:hypothetical protein